MPDLTRQQLCAALGISESTVRRLELLGLPFTPAGLRAKRYDLGEQAAGHRRRDNSGHDSHDSNASSAVQAARRPEVDAGADRQRRPCGRSLHERINASMST